MSAGSTQSKATLDFSRKNPIIPGVIPAETGRIVDLLLFYVRISYMVSENVSRGHPIISRCEEGMDRVIANDTPLANPIIPRLLIQSCEGNMKYVRRPPLFVRPHSPLPSSAEHSLLILYFDPHVTFPKDGPDHIRLCGPFLFGTRLSAAYPFLLR
jgi:hypothetical protein